MIDCLNLQASLKFLFIFCVFYLIKMAHRLILEIITFFFLPKTDRVMGK